MKINDNRERSDTRFGTIRVGEVFSWNSEFWMRILLCVNTSGPCNAVNITNGTLIMFKDSDFVRKVKAELNIS